MPKKRRRKNLGRSFFSVVSQSMAAQIRKIQQAKPKPAPQPVVKPLQGSKKIKGSFCETTEAQKSRFDRRSFRWKKSGKTWVLIGCPRGKWNSRTERCRVGTRAVKILRPRTGTSCRVGKRLTK